jgi:hypothetical protein
MHTKAPRPTAPCEADRVPGFGPDQGIGEFDPTAHAVEIRPDSQGFKQLLPAVRRHYDRRGAAPVPPGMGRQPGDQARDVVRMAVGEEHGLLLREERRAPPHVDRRFEVFDHEGGG